MKQSEKKSQLNIHKKCYVCDALGLTHAGFSGYKQSEINFDHWKPKGLVGSDQAALVANQLPLHAHPDGPTYADDGYETSTKRNCHKGKGNRFESGLEWVEAVKIHRSVRTLTYAEDLLPKRDRNLKSSKVTIAWDASTGLATFNGDTYPMIVQKTRIGAEEVAWRSFSTVVAPALLWTDEEVQSRPAVRERVAELAIHLRRSPLLTPILCRYADGHLNVFDGNHRLCAFLLARPGDGVPVVIFEGPDPKRFLEVVGQAHDELTQQKYQYTAKALKYSALNASELQDAIEKFGDDASEKLAWEGKTSKDVRLRIIGRLTARLDERGGWRNRWKEHGLVDKSWNEFLSMYAKLTPASEPFSSKDYCRDNEVENLAALCTMFDDELFKRFGAVPKARASLKTKWWSAAHRRFATRAKQVVRDTMQLPTTPEHIAYLPKVWPPHIKKMFRSAVKQWTESPAWRANTTANNQPDVVKHLNKYSFTENYLMQ